MWSIVVALLGSLRSALRGRGHLVLENLALRQQLAPLHYRSKRLSRRWAGWREVLVFVQPSTVVAWQRRRFRDHWARLSRSAPGRPAIDESVRDLIRKMSSANPRWGSPRIVGELAKVGIQVAKATVEKYMV